VIEKSFNQGQVQYAILFVHVPAVATMQFFLIIYIIRIQNLIFNKNIMENYTTICEKYQNIVSRTIETIPTKITFL
jgi:hypothetical protein